MARTRSSSAGADRAVEREEDVDVRMQAELTPAVAAERDDEAGIAGGRRVGEQALSRSSTQSRALQRRATRPPCAAADTRVARGVSSEPVMLLAIAYG